MSTDKTQMDQETVAPLQPIVRLRVGATFTRKYPFQGREYPESRMVQSVGWLPEIGNHGVAYKLLGGGDPSLYHFATFAEWSDWERHAERVA